jgi:hypothetical protein
MRIGEWVPVFKRTLPIPQRLGMAFGLHEGSELNVVKIADDETHRTHGCELIVSPIPANDVSFQCHMPNIRALPEYTMITGNTEQRDLRVLFLRDYENMFRGVLNDDLPDFAGGGIGLLNRLLNALPHQINLIRATITFLRGGTRSPRGESPSPATGTGRLRCTAEGQTRRAETTFQQTIESL